MACTHVTTDQDFVSDLEMTEDFLKLEKIQSTITDKTIKLPRGGIIVQSKIGNFQFGMVPETLKDVINEGHDFPKYYILPTQRFDKKYGINVAEFEFPAYFNFFVKQRRVNLICSEEAEKAIRIVFQETLLGPVDHPNLDKDFDIDYSKDRYPEFRKENYIFSRNENDPNDKGLTVDTLINFIKYDSKTNIANISQDGIEIQVKYEEDQYISIIENGVVLEKLKDQIKLEEYNIQNLVNNFQEDEQRNQNEMHIINEKEHKVCISSKDLNIPDSESENSEASNIQYNFMSKRNSFREIRGSAQQFNKFIWSQKGGKTKEMDYLKNQNIAKGESFSPPDFGITILGASHGFDPKGSTSGFIIWVYGKGIMVDPPPFASNYLKLMGIQTHMLIKAIIITHCHADHDAGAFHKVLDDSQIEIITTRTIMGSFLKKYSALSNISKEQLQILFTFRPVIIGEIMNIYGANFKFFYALHTIPCIGFESRVEDKSMYFSADTFYHPEKLKELNEKGKLSYRRYEQLAFPDFESQNIILHEAGVPPIHTPQSVLAALPPHIKNKLYLIHIAQKDLKKELGLKIVGMGVENTLIILGSNRVPNLQIKRRLELLSNIDIMQALTIKNINWLLDSLKVQNFVPGDMVFEEGDYGKNFYIIENGVARIFSDKKGSSFERYFSIGDYFGESSLIVAPQNSKRAGNVQAVTDLTLLTIGRNDFWFVFGNGSDGPGKVIQKFQNLSDSRKYKVNSVLQKNSLLSELTPGQKTQLEMILTLKEAKKGDVIWKKEDKIEFGVLIKRGAFQFFDCQEDEELVPGYFVSETRQMIEKGFHKTNLKCVNKGEYLTILRQDLMRFLWKNPGLNILFRDYIYFD